MQDHTTTLNALLHDAHLTRAELSRLIGVSPRNISRWNSYGIPQYAIAYLQLRAEHIALMKRLDGQ